MKYLVVSYGGGVNSKAMVVEMVNRDIRPEMILFADTGGEFPETYTDIAKTSMWLMKKGYPAITVIKSTRQHGTLENECLKKETLPSLAFGFKTCSQAWKIHTQKMYVRNSPAFRQAADEGQRITFAIGYDAGEERGSGIAGDKDFDNFFPLKEWKLDREACRQSIINAGLCVPKKSACFFCPAAKPHEIVRMAKTHPDLLDRALKMEASANAGGKLGVVKGLGRHWSWAEVIEADKNQQKLDFIETLETPCGCYDGGDYEEYGDDQ